ncbi:ACBP-domain-containing protein [Backusella circina FSU 941]|nr:ACBP-domain-containing protein [Backusella circina FSU 941]
MAIIPPQHSERYINQRYNKALYIVQHLPASSNVQPTKEQKLELYALYKQVSLGDISTQRPGIFDVVGRAKWDAWKKLQGLSEQESKHRYVEILLQVATEAYKKPAGRAQAQHIIQSFAVRQSTDESGDSSSDSGLESADSQDEEERAYLQQIQSARIPPPRPLARGPPRKVWHGSRLGATSRASSQTMMTAPSQMRRYSQSSSGRPQSVASSSISGLELNASRRKPREYYDENLANSNPWDLHPSTLQYKVDQQTPVLGTESVSSSITARQGQSTAGDGDEVSSVLGPATKKALESLKSEIVALNERIDGLRNELKTRDHRKTATPAIAPRKPKDERWEGWKWVYKATLRHAFMNLATAVLLFILLYKNNSPIAHVIIKVILRMWQRIKLRLMISSLL